MRRTPSITAPQTPRLRCAVYTRKSSEEGLEQAFNSLDAQRQRCEDYARSQDWIILPEHFDDGGISGGTMERPGLQRLLVAIERGEIDVVACYRVDRLSRRLLDFAKLMDEFERHGVSFVSVTESFNTGTSAGRLHLNMTLSFAQHEREVASERTRDKIALARQRGQWSGGPPILGYDIASDRTGSRLVVNEVEAEQVRRIFQMYLDFGSVMKTLAALDGLGWTTKRWTAKNGNSRGGAPFNKSRLHALLSNIAYRGKVRHHEKVYEGEHEAIVPEALWKRVQALLARNAHTGGAEVRNTYGAILKGLVRCAHCQCPMGHTHSQRGNRRWRYYTCTQAQKRGVRVCPNRSVNAHQIEQFVINEIKSIGRDPALVEQVINATNRQAGERQRELATEIRIIDRDHRRAVSDLKRGTDAGFIADLNERIAQFERRRQEVVDEIAALRSEAIAPDQVRTALAEFDQLWSMLSPREQARVMQTLIEQVTVNKPAGTVQIEFRPNGLRSLSEQQRMSAKADAA